MIVRAADADPANAEQGLTFGRPWLWPVDEAQTARPVADDGLHDPSLEKVFASFFKKKFFFEKKNQKTFI
jgi:hypothetical protein